VTATVTVTVYHICYGLLTELPKVASSDS